MTAPWALELEGIDRAFGPVQALRGATLRVREGTVHGLLGENGAGKTTLMRVAYGLVQPDRGTIRIRGEAVRLANPARAIAAGIGLVHQHPLQVPTMTAVENLALGGRGTFRPDVARAETLALARQVGFAIDVDSPVAELPVAAQQRVEILKAIGRGARILILDEPTAALAPEDARELLAWLRQFAAGGGTAIVITHNLEEARGVADDLTVLRGGATVLQSPSAGVTATDLATAMLGEAPPRSPLPAAATMGDVVLRITDLAVRDERGRAAVRRATFEVRRGEIVGIAGVEGSGHHELLLALAGRLPASAGTLETPAVVGLVPEDRHRDAVVLEFGLDRNVAIAGIGARRGGIAWRAVAARTRELISAFDVRARGPSQPMSTLSGGNQQKLVLAREVAGGASLLVLENPTRGLDIRAAAFVRDQVQRARAAGVAVVIYSPDLDELLAQCDRVFAMHAGVLSAAARDRDALGQAMLGVTVGVA